MSLMPVELHPGVRFSPVVVPTTVRVADYIAEFIHGQGVNHVFMLTGGGSIFLDDGVACHPKLQHVCARNEATAPMMAEAYARLTGNLGAVYVTTGPGGTNAVAGLAEAWVDSSPVLIVSGQVSRHQTSHKQRGFKVRSFGIQEIDIVAVVSSMTKYAVMVDDPADIRYHLEKAVYLARSGRPGPVWLDVPLDVQEAEIVPQTLRGFEPPASEHFDDSDGRLVRHATDVLDLLRDARRPLFIIGQGVRISGAIDELCKAAERMHVPVIPSRLGQDILPGTHPCNLGHAGIYGQRHTGYLMRQADLVVAIGSRLAVGFLGEGCDAFAPDARIVMVDIDKSELCKNSVPVHMPILADARAFLNALLDELARADVPDHSGWLRQCSSIKASHPIVTEDYARDPIDLYYFISRLNKASTAGDVFVNDAGSSYFASGQALTFEHAQREITSGAFAACGVAIPLAIGSAMARPDSRILAVTGDGSLELNIQELKTLSAYGCNVKLFVINNGGYVSIRITQNAVCDGRFIGSSDDSGVAELNLKKIAEAFDLPYRRIATHREIDTALTEIFSGTGPVFVEVMCDPNQTLYKSTHELSD